LDEQRCFDGKTGLFDRGIVADRDCIFMWEETFPYHDKFMKIGERDFDRGRFCLTTETNTNVDINYTRQGPRITVISLRTWIGRRLFQSDVISLY